MSELPPDLRKLLDAGKRAHEPDAARLERVYQRVVYAPHVNSEYDVAPPSVPRVRLPWGSMLTAGALAVTSWWATSSPQVTAPPVASPPVQIAAPSAEVEPASQRIEAPPIVVPRTSVPPEMIEKPPELPIVTADAPSVAAPGNSGPSSDWPVASTSLRRARSGAQPLKPVTREDLSLEIEAPPEDEERTASLQPSWEDLGGDGDTRMHKSRAPTVVAPTREMTDSLGDEVRWLVRARQALERGDWQAAKEALEEHQYAHPSGQLQAERRALLARVRCLGGDLAGARRLYVLLKEEAGSSSLLRSVERACPTVAP